MINKNDKILYDWFLLVYYCLLLNSIGKLVKKIYLIVDFDLGEGSFDYLSENYEEWIVFFN